MKKKLSRIIPRLISRYNDLKAAVRRLWRRNRPLVGGLIVAAVAVLVLILIPRTDKKLVSAAEGVMTIAENVRQAYRAKPSYWGLHTNKAIQEGLIPAGMIKNQMAINALGQKILIGQGINGDMVMPGMSGFDVVYPNISRKYCVLLLSYQFKEQQLLGLKSITLDNGEEQTVFVWGGENPLPISREQVVSRCKAKNTLLWSFE